MRWFRSIFAWRDALTNSPIWLYQENSVTGARRAIRIGRGSWSPLNWHWLRGGVGVPYFIDER